MADNNATGLTTARKGSAQYTFTFNSTAPGTTPVTTPITINATALVPVYIEGSIQVVTAGGGTSPTVGIGLTSSGTDLIGLFSTTATGFFPANNAVAKSVATDTATLYIREGGTPAGTGVYRIIIKAASLNLNPGN
jgi:hypothetical protein